MAAEADMNDYSGRTLLNEALIEGNMELASTLIADPNADKTNALLYAIKYDRRQALMQILNEMNDRVLEMSPTQGVSADFDPDITPLAIAAMENNHFMVKILIDRGHQLEIPHSAQCECLNCLRSDAFLEEKVNKYRAVTSQAYVFQVARDPLLTLFQYRKELEEWAEIETEFRKEYTELAQECAENSAIVMSACITVQEAQSLLSIGDLKIGKFPRLALAVDCNEKKFVSHPFTQKMLHSEWYSGWEKWHKIHLLRKIIHILIHVIALPFIFPIYIVKSDLKFLSSWRSAKGKFWSWLASHVVCMLALLLMALGVGSMILEIYLILYMIGLLVFNVRRIILFGNERFKKGLWFWYDILFIVLFFTNNILWLYLTMYYERNYTKYLPVSLWRPDDPRLIGDVGMALVTMMAFIKITYFSQVIRGIGALQIALINMTRDIAHFFAIFAIIMFSFAVGFSCIYHKYGSEKNSFHSPTVSMVTLFWALFGMVDDDQADVVLQGFNTTNHRHRHIVVYNHHAVTQIFGRGFFMIYLFTAVIVMINLLIAMMSDTFSRVIENADEEWKFFWSKVWLTFRDEASTLPPPLNIIPPLQACRKYFGKHKEKELQHRESNAVDYYTHYRTLVRRLAHDYRTRVSL